MKKVNLKTTFLIVLSFIFSSLIFTSCEQWEYDSPYDDGVPFVDTNISDWHNNYPDSGVLNNEIIILNNPLFGTKWSLTEYRVGFGPIQHPHDTLYFVNNTSYTINNDTMMRGYKLSFLTFSTNKELTLYYFSPFGGSHYSGQVGANFIYDGKINNASFTDLQNPNIKIQAYFERIL